MSIFDSIKNAIFGHGAASSSTPGANTPPAAPAGPGAVAAGAAPAVPPTGTAAPANTAISAQDLNAKLTALSAKSTQKLNWQTSIVDLMKLVGLDPSLANRKQLAQELGFKGDANDSAAMNIWLHQAVMERLAQSGGQVTAALHA